MRCALACVLGCLLAAAGCATARPPCAALDLALRLPFSGERLVIQGNDSAFTHSQRARYAWDFALPEGTEVLAAADGVVVEVLDGFSEGGLDHKLDDRANLVVIDHGGARFSVYQHLQRGGALVHEGDRVRRGQPIARSGNTGFSAGPHLHFVVIDQRNRSQPVCFADVQGGVPVEGRAYATRAFTAAPSTLPRDTFAKNGIELINDLPARRWTGAVTIEGRALEPARRAVAFFMPRDRSRPPKPWFADVRDGRFAITVDARELVELGPADFALALVGDDGAWRSDFSVPIVAREIPVAPPPSTPPSS